MNMNICIMLFDKHCDEYAWSCIYICLAMYIDSDVSSCDMMNIIIMVMWCDGMMNVCIMNMLDIYLVL